MALFDLVIDSKLRGCDLVQLRIGHLVINAAARHRATIVQQKTGKPVQFELTQQTRESLIVWLTHRGGGLQDFVFPSRTDADSHISTRQYARLVGDWVESIGLGRSAYGTHSLRRTKVALIYKRTGNLRAVQILLGHGRYIGRDTEAAARYLALSPHSLECYRSLGGGPPFYNFGKFVRYAVPDLETWAAGCLHERTPGGDVRVY